MTPGIPGQLTPSYSLISFLFCITSSHPTLFIFSTLLVSTET
ncbi:hypothetical protein SA22_3083 [Salmonella enterica subsp. enterica serovar Agona str. 22.H.04]|uniref:Uncharacterized protein n=1 Tax=Salmonella agona (strain SL483) TaxID=454166 RepID=B5F898_SALA4|nr:hypothetical protein SeAg_B1926 [Salmonella enterica subsp. enterica serovar Agona str. SL483]CCR02122.1 hypothetical protein SA73_3355 [Salmonella enterica subsp. enterica serovar Agona str. 73.H.09]CCR07900.1 hypothetical protein SA72_4497 [Salmonella enterica subsp. enterica serovar Agona str. 72.A.52]CCR11212.1 hypothetical protein SA71_3201 [Salmonella enterica subsp. enterica serovar Agona str. 71.E.05]CCR15600.1 hypothetical protein SA70_2983 [Salmonella enterica subsp. enterica serov